MTKEWVERGNIFEICNVYLNMGVYVVLCLYGEWIAERIDGCIHVPICFLYYFSFESLIKVLCDTYIKNVIGMNILFIINWL